MSITEETTFSNFTDVTNSESPSDSESGTGGGTMDSFDSRQGIIDNLLVANFTNQSSFGIPPAISEITAFSNFSGEKNGTVVEGDFRDSDNTPLSGSLDATDDSGTVASLTVSGFFAFSAGVSSGVASGSDSTGSVGIDITYTPDGDGLPYTESVSGATDIGQIVYGEVSGSVTDYNGDPVVSDRVSFGDNDFFTDSNGSYSVKGPGGQSYNIGALKGSKSLSLSFSGGSVTNQDFQYGGIDAKLSLPGGDGIQGVEVSTDATVGKKKTDENGEVRFVESEVGGTVNVSIGDFNISVAGPSEGGLSTATKQTGFGVKGIVEDGSGVRIASLDIFADVENQLKAAVDENGNFKVGADDSGKVTIVIGESDRRYQKEEFEVDVQQGDVIDNLVVNMEPQENISTFG